MGNLRIAIDGPAGAGKSTIARKIAQYFNILHLDTGAMYRAIGLFSIEEGVDPQNEHEVYEMLKNIKIDVKYKDNKQQTLLNGVDVSDKIRTEEVSKAASAVSKWPEVRKMLVAIQKDISSKMSLVMDGRDIGTHVMPDAEYKFFLTASVEQRAKRRFLELNEKGFESNYESIKDEIEKRDYQDMNRKYAPLRKAQDAFQIDTTDLSINQVEKEILTKIGRQ